MTTKPETVPAKETKEPKTKDKTLFIVTYDPTARAVRIGTLAIPTWILSFIAGALVVIVFQALVNQGK